MSSRGTLDVVVIHRYIYLFFVRDFCCLRCDVWVGKMIRAHIMMSPLYSVCMLCPKMRMTIYCSTNVLFVFDAEHHFNYLHRGMQ